MLIERDNNLLVQITADHLAELTSINEGVIAGWLNDQDIPVDADGQTIGSILTNEQGVTIWLGKRRDAYSTDRVRETPRVWLDSPSARQWVEMADGDVDAAVEAINAHVVHDADESAPDCNRRDHDTGATCTLAAGHGGSKHVAGVGRACIYRVFAAL